MEEENATQDRAIGRLEGMISALQTTVGSISNDISGLRNDFKTMEAGRLSRLEVSFATMATEMGMKAKSTSMFWAAVISILTSVGSGLIIYFLLHK